MEALFGVNEVEETAVLGELQEEVHLVFDLGVNRRAETEIGVKRFLAKRRGKYLETVDELDDVGVVELLVNPDFVSQVLTIRLSDFENIDLVRLLTNLRAKVWWDLRCFTS